MPEHLAIKPMVKVIATRGWALCKQEQEKADTTVFVSIDNSQNALVEPGCTAGRGDLPLPIPADALEN